MAHFHPRAVRNEDGAALVEFVLVLPLLLLLLIGMLDLGKAFNYWIDETHLANEGARYAAVNKNPDRARAFSSPSSPRPTRRPCGTSSRCASPSRAPAAQS